MEKKYKIAIALLSFNRYEYLLRCLESLGNSDISGITLVIIDDHSSDKRVRRYIREFAIDDVEIKKIFLRQNTGHPNYVVKKALKYFRKHYPDYDFWGIIDNDMIFSKDWLTILLNHYEESRKLGQKISFLTAFNATGGPADYGSSPILETFTNKYGKYGFKKFVGGAQVLFKPRILDEFGFFPTKIKWFWKKRNMRGWDQPWMFKSQELGYHCLVTIPSYVQHIGVKGMHSKNNIYDRAIDFIGNAQGETKL